MCFNIVICFGKFSTLCWLLSKMSLEKVPEFFTRIDLLTSIMLFFLITISSLVGFRIGMMTLASEELGVHSNFIINFTTR